MNRGFRHLIPDTLADEHGSRLHTDTYSHEVSWVQCPCCRCVFIPDWFNTRCRRCEHDRVDYEAAVRSAEEEGLHAVTALCAYMGVKVSFGDDIEFLCLALRWRVSTQGERDEMALNHHEKARLDDTEDDR